MTEQSQQYKGGMLQIQEPKLSRSTFNLLNSHLSPTSVLGLIVFDCEVKLWDVVTKNPLVSPTFKAKHPIDNA